MKNWNVITNRSKRKHGKKDRKQKQCHFLCVCFLLTLLTGCQVVESSIEVLEEFQRESVAIDETVSINELSVIDNSAIYAEDDPASLVYFYVTVRYGSEAKGTNHTFAQVNDVVRFADGSHIETEVYAEALVQVGDEYGPAAGMLGYEETKSNATIRVRGSSSTTAAIKSYRLKLEENAGTWRGQTNIALNKHAYDTSRIRNKLYFDILKDIPEVPSIRTQFVVLYIKDETAGETEFKNYGIYTQAEVPSKRYLKNHGMDSDGYLYKVINFNWETNEYIKNQTDPEYDEAAMDTVISCRGKEENQKLIDLVAAVNDMTQDIDTVIDTYFDRENYISWLAYNILIGNIDTTMQNYYLYSPLNGEKWYFIPWDGDASLRRQELVMKGDGEKYGELTYGISNYWGTLLHQRFLKQESNREQLAEKVEELYALLTKEYLLEKIKLYDSVVKPFIEQMPDVLHLGMTLEERDSIIATLCDEVTFNYEKFLESLTSLMPIWIYEPEQQDKEIAFSWEDAYDFLAANVTYNVKISRYPDMQNPIFAMENLELTGCSVSKAQLGTGRFYLQVTANSADGRNTKAFNQITVNDISYQGIYEFDIE